jgi:hypothetical protein
MSNSRYLDENSIPSALSDNSLEATFDSTAPNRPSPLSDVFKDIGDFFTNTGKSAENANKITEKVEKGLDKATPYLLAVGIVFGAMAISQTVKNVQEIKKNAK